MIEKKKKTKLNNYTIQHNETKSIDRVSYIELKPYMSNNVNINGATDRTSIKCHKIYKEIQTPTFTTDHGVTSKTMNLFAVLSSTN